MAQQALSELESFGQSAPSMPSRSVSSCAWGLYDATVHWKRDHCHISHFNQPDYVKYKCVTQPNGVNSCHRKTAQELAAPPEVTPALVGTKNPRARDARPGQSSGFRRDAHPDLVACVGSRKSHLAAC